MSFDHHRWLGLVRAHTIWMAVRPKELSRRRICVSIGTFVCVLLVGCTSAVPNLPADSTQSDTTTQIGTARQDPAATLISAFFGLDNGLPLPANLRICRGASGADGMPVIFSREIDATTLQAGDFRVLRQSGALGTVLCVTLAPATDPGELRTVLLVGEFGNTEDPPVSVAISGNLLSIDRALNFNGASVGVTPLAPGPTLVLAQIMPQRQWKVGQTSGSFGSGSGCPTTTQQAVRVTWAGGVTIPGGGDAGDAERVLYKVALQRADGSLGEIIPFALGDLDDGDNNHALCLDVAGTPISVSFPAGHLRDPNGDLNPATNVGVSVSMQ